jgi:3-isopropylmalate/(R)-2-methylmalate dehydratase small subunit
MSGESTLRSRAYLLARADIDTDQILPSRFQSKIDGKTSLADFFFHDQRFHADGRKVAAMPLNDPALAGAQILVAPSNYACGSARAGAIFAHVDFGIRVLISESFGSVFATVCYKFGLIPVELPKAEITFLIDALATDPGTVLEVDIAAQEIRLTSGAVLGFQLDEYVRFIARSGKDEIALTRSSAAEIEAFEQKRMRALPWLFA